MLTSKSEPAAAASDATSTAQLPPPPNKPTASSTGISPPSPIEATTSLTDLQTTQKTNKSIVGYHTIPYNPRLRRPYITHVVLFTIQIFHVSLLYNLVLCRQHKRPWWSRIMPHLVLGALPLREKHHLEMLTQEEGVQAVVTMNQPTELLPNWLGTPVTPDDWVHAHVEQCFGRTGDFKPPSVETIHHCVDFLHAHIQANQTTYVHCKAGRGRSTVVVLAYLMQHHAMTLDDAHAFVVARRRHISLHPKQRAILTAFAASS